MGSVKEPSTTRVGVRELRQNLSVYLDRVKEGERMEVTERGKPVALLVPLPEESPNSLEAMIADGRVIAAKHDLGEYLAKHPPLPPLPGEKTLTQILLEMRDEETF